MSAEGAPAGRRRTHWLVWVFALVGLLGLVAVIFLAFAIFQIGRPYQPAKVSGAAPESIFTIGNVQGIPGTGLIQLDIETGTGPGPGSLSRGRSDDVRNILLMDKATGASRRLLPDNGRRITDRRFLPARTDLYDTEESADALRPNGEKEAPAAYYLLLVRQAEREDLYDLLVGTLSSGRQAYVMRGIDGADSIWMHSPTRIGMIVRERLGLYHRIVDIPTLKVVYSKRIEIG